MHRNDIERVAVDHPISAEGLGEVLDRLREQREHVDHYLDKAWHATTDDRLLGEAAGHYVFALERTEWERLADDLDLSERQLAAAIAAHRVWADDLLVLGTPSIRDVDDLADDDVEPFVLPYPDNWRFAREMFGWHWAHLIQDIGLRPAELVDYWMTEHEQNTPDTWAGVRGVTAEAVRKNARQAAAKLEEYREQR